MKRMAIFVEGQTEQIFINKLLEEIAGKKNIAIEIQKLVRVEDNCCQFTIIKAERNLDSKEFYVLIRNCCNDEKVKSALMESHSSLVKKGYDCILGLRDVFPIDRAKIPKLKRGMRYGLPQVDGIDIGIVLAVMEVEAWFLAEYNHFTKIHEELTIERIDQEFGFNPEIDDMEMRPHPSEDLRSIYNLVGLGYQKKKRQVNRTVNLLDYEELYCELPRKVNSLAQLVGKIDIFLS